MLNPRTLWAPTASAGARTHSGRTAASSRYPAWKKRSASRPTAPVRRAAPRLAAQSALSAFSVLASTRARKSACGTYLREGAFAKKIGEVGR